MNIENGKENLLFSLPYPKATLLKTGIFTTCPAKKLPP